MSDIRINDPKGIPATGSWLSLLRSSGVAVGARIAGAVAGIVLQLLLALHLSAQEIGLFFVATGYAAVLSIICTLGYPMLMPKMAAQAEADRGGSMLPDFLFQARRDTLILSMTFSLILFTLAIGISSFSEITRLSLIFAAFTLPPVAFLRLNGSLANAMKRFELGFIPELLVKPLLLLATAVILWHAFADHLTIQNVLIANIVIAALVVCVQWHRLAGIVKPYGTSSGTPPPGLVAEWHGRAAPIVIGALFLGVFADLDIVIARLFMDDAQIGVFGLCLKISLFVAFGIQAVHQVILRDTADALYRRDTRTMRGIITRANAITMAGSLAATAVIIFYGREILGLFGEEFRAGYDCLVLLMIAQVCRAAAGPAGQVLTLAGLEKTCLPVFIASLLILIMGNALLIPPFGLTGAAGTVLIVSIYWPLRLTILAHQKLGLRTAIM